ncbi:MAG TPA: hypothetical protein VH164_13355 [Ktedonobacteraceae bacterium]|nr:hypothetical protein [Ktedonobacteraceae bacterium]
MNAVAAGYSGDSGMYRRLQELREAEPFCPFYISMSDGKDFKVLKAADLEFHVSGLPQVRKSAGRWATLNPDQIIAITIGVKPPHL